MAKRRQRGEIIKSGDDLFNGVWNDYSGMNIRAVIKMGYFLSLMMLGMSMECVYKERLISTKKGRKIKEG
jgi:hypothetical protein